MLTPIECGKRCRTAFGEQFKIQFGPYRFRNRKIIFRDKAFFSLYSDYHEQISGWFYDIPKIEWEDWQDKSLLFLMKEGNEVNYLILNQEEAITLLNKIHPVSGGVKKINIRRPTNAGKMYIVEWKELNCYKRILPLNVFWS